MNRAIKDLGLIIFSAAAGSIITFLSVKGYYEAKADKEVESVREAYDRKINQIEGLRTSLAGDIEGPEEIPEEKIIAEKAKSSIVEKLNNKPPLKDYTKYFTEKGEERLNLRETVRDAKADAESDEAVGDSEPSEEEDIEKIDKELNGGHREAIKEGKEPYVIDRSDYELTCSQYDKIDLVYYISDDVLCEEGVNGVEEVNRYDLVGDLIAESGFDQNEDDELLVRNDKLSTDFDICKVYTAYEV